MNDNTNPITLAEYEAAAREINDRLYPAAEHVSRIHGPRMTVAGLLATAGQLAAAEGLPPAVFLDVALATLHRMVNFVDPITGRKN